MVRVGGEGCKLAVVDSVGCVKINGVEGGDVGGWEGWWVEGGIWWDVVGAKIACLVCCWGGWRGVRGGNCAGSRWNWFVVMGVGDAGVSGGELRDLFKPVCSLTRSSSSESL